MGNASAKAKEATNKAKEAHAQHKSKPKNNKSVQQQKIQTSKATGVLALPERKLKRVPSEIFALTNLRTLDLSQNRLDEIPSEINGLTNLKILKIQSNALTTLPDLSALTALTTASAYYCCYPCTLILDGNAIQSITNSLPPNLTKLSLKGNQLRMIPQTITSLGQLQEIDVSENQLTEIPQHITQLRELVDLCVDRNALQLLPASLAQCGKLKVISARHNQLHGAAKGQQPQKPQSIAKEILAQSLVHIMNLDGNPMHKIDLEAMDGIESFMERRTLLKNKEIHGGLSTDTSLCGLD